MKIKHILIIFSASILIILISISYISSYKLLCLTDGQKLPPNVNPPRYECEHDTCTVCVTNNYYPTALAFCNNQPNCNVYDPGNGSGTVIDSQPPVLTINSPLNNAKFNSKYVLFDIKTDEKASIYYGFNGQNKFSKLASLVKSYLKSLSFKDGLGDITIKAVDDNGNEALIIRSFYVDSKKPKITKTLPGKGFANGKFEVLFSESNPVSVTLDYGNNIKGRRTADVPISSCTHDDKGKYYCSINAALDDYNDQDIDYKFRVVDIVENSIESKAITLKVDSANPVITNSPIYSINGKYVIFKLNITEVNFDKVSYIDNSLLRPSWKSLCSSLKNNVCEKKLTFTKGSHVVDVKILDKAGNELVQRISFDMDY